MLNILQIEDRLKDMSEDSVKRIVVDPNPSVPAFLAVNELNRRDRIKKDYQMSQQEERPTVAEQLVTGAGMPTQAVSDMAMTMSPQTNVAGNTGLEAMMPQRATPEEMPSEEEQDLMLMEDEEPLRMSYGGLINSRIMAMGQPRRMDYQENRHFPMGRRTFQSGLDNLGRDISGRVENRTQEEVQEFVGDVDNMAQERFDVNLSEPSMGERRQGEITSHVERGFGGKGMPPIMRAMNEDPRVAMLKEGGVVETPAMSEELQEIIVNAARALQGATDEPEKDINRFVETFGVQALNDLRERVASGEMSMGKDGGLRGMISGEGDGMSDSIEAEIVESVGDEAGTGRPLQVANNEYVVAADVVSDIGNGSSEAGAKKLDDLMKKVRLARHGTTQQPKEKDMMSVMKESVK